MHTMSYMHKLCGNGCRFIGYDSEYLGTCHRLYSYSISVADVAPPPASASSASATVTTSASASLFSPSLIPHLMLYVASIELQVAVLFVAVASCAF